MSIKNKLKISLSQPRYDWKKLSRGWFCGKGFLDNKNLSPTLLETKLSECHSKEALVQLLDTINGTFSLIWSFDDSTTFAVVDIARALPLFWKVDGDQIHLTDQLDKTMGVPSLWLAENCFEHSTFVPGHTTLLAGWNQLQAGELLEIKSGFCYIDTWFSHHRQLNTKDKDYFFYEDYFKQCIDQLTKRLIQWANGRRIVIPLSGGYDSRFIIAALIKQGYTNIKAFTYGLSNSLEVNTANKIAHQLSLNWVFVPYTPQLLDQFFTDKWKQYVEYGCNMSSLPQDQDFFALEHLTTQGWLEKGDIICPGFCGDFQAGSYLLDRYFTFPWRNTKSLQAYLSSKYLFQKTKSIQDLWQFHLPKTPLKGHDALISELENWALKEYVSKYIVNGIRAYEFFDCDWYLPLWDKEFIEFWQKVPNQFRQDMGLYRKTLESYLFKPLDIYYPKNDAIKPIALWKSVLAVNLKDHLKQYIHRDTTQNVNGFSYLSEKVQQLMKLDVNVSNINHNQMIGSWVNALLQEN